MALGLFGIEHDGETLVSRRRLAWLTGSVTLPTAAATAPTNAPTKAAADGPLREAAASGLAQPTAGPAHTVDAPRHATAGEPVDIAAAEPIHAQPDRLTHGAGRGRVEAAGGPRRAVADEAAHAAPDGPANPSAGRARPRFRAGWRVRRWLPPGCADVRVDPRPAAALAVAAVVLVGAALAGFGVWRSRPVAEPVPAALPAAGGAGPTSAANGELVVSVAGLVVRPGLVRLQPGARVADAVAAAGGPLPDTDLAAVNLARRLADGEHVVVGPAAPVPPGPVGPAAPQASGARIDLNTATLADLDALPGIGPVTAQRILDWRAAHGRFASVDQLREIDGIGETRFSRLRELVTA